VTAPLESRTWPSDPTGPNQAPAGYHTPATLANPNQDPPKSSNEIEAYRGNFIEMILRKVVEALTGSFIPGLGHAFGQLVTWATSTLPDLIMTPIQQLVDAIIAILGPIPIVGGLIENLANFLGLTSQSAQDAQDTADSALTQLSSGADIFDNFDRSDATDLGADYTQNYGSGSGTLGIYRNDAAWRTSGSNVRQGDAIHNTALSNDNCVVKVITSNSIDNVNTDPYYHIIGRSDAAGDNYVVAYVHRTSLEIGYVASGTYTQWDTVSISVNKGTWELHCGSGGDPYDFEIFLDGNSKLFYNDGAHDSSLGALYRHPGFGMDAGRKLFGTYSQYGPPRIIVFAASNA
jgi:hypothetical protein